MANPVVETFKGEIFLDEDTGDLDYNAPEAEVFLNEFFSGHDDSRKIIDALVPKMRKAADKLEASSVKFEKDLEKAKAKGKEIKKSLIAKAKAEAKFASEGKKVNSKRKKGAK
jgi:hypothetical protein